MTVPGPFGPGGREHRLSGLWPPPFFYLLGTKNSCSRTRGCYLLPQYPASKCVPAEQAGSRLPPASQNGQYLVSHKPLSAFAVAVTVWAAGQVEGFNVGWGGVFQ